MTRLTEFTPRLTDGYVPDLEHGELAVVVKDGTPREFWFQCPCGCGDTHRVPSAATSTRDNEPTWTLTAETDGTYSASPSILRRGGCGSHFFITRNKVVWC